MCEEVFARRVVNNRNELSKRSSSAEESEKKIDTSFGHYKNQTVGIDRNEYVCRYKLELRSGQYAPEDFSFNYNGHFDS
jgi:hypothetical protein